MANEINSSLILSGLSTYVDQLTQSEILIESVFSARTAKIVNRVTGVKGTQAINVMTSQPVWTVASCGPFSGTGSETLSQQNITVQDIMGQEAVCQVGAGSIAKYWTGVLMPKGINQVELTPANFAKAFVADKQNKQEDLV